MGWVSESRRCHSHPPRYKCGSKGVGAAVISCKVLFVGKVIPCSPQARWNISHSHLTLSTQKIWAFFRNSSQAAFFEARWFSVVCSAAASLRQLILWHMGALPGQAREFGRLLSIRKICRDKENFLASLVVLPPWSIRATLVVWLPWDYLVVWSILSDWLVRPRHSVGIWWSRLKNWSELLDIRMVSIRIQGSTRNLVLPYFYGTKKKIKDSKCPSSFMAEGLVSWFSIYFPSSGKEPTALASLRSFRHVFLHRYVLLSK